MSVAFHSRPSRSFTTKPLGEVFDVVGGGTPPKNNASYFSGDIPWATIRDMHSDVLAETEHTISQEGLRHSSAKLIPAGEVIMASRVGLGKACILQRDTAINQDIRALLPLKPNTVDRHFCLYWLQSVKDDIIAAGTGATVQGIKLPFIKSLPFPDVPFEEQKRIVAVLDQAFAALDRARALAEANLADAEALFSAQLRIALDQMQALHGLSDLGSHVDFKNGFAFKSSKFVDAGQPVVRISNIQNGAVTLEKVVYARQQDYREDLSKYLVEEGELLIAMSGATTGKIGFNKTGMMLLQNQRVGRFAKTSSINLDYLAFFLETKVAEHLDISAGAAQPNLSTKQISEVMLPIPHREQQAEFVSRMGSAKAMCAAARGNYEKQLDALADLRQSLLQRAFAGELT